MRTTASTASSAEKAWDKDKMNEKELEYYLKVNERILKKMRQLTE